MAATKKINLALQGGGAHGAFTWGVLDRLLEEERLVIEGISGTSAGALNGVMFANGYLKGGRDGAKQCLEQFWKKVSEAGALNPLQKNPFDHTASGWNMDYSPGYHWFDLMSRVFSPYVFNPLNVNPLNDLLKNMVDFKKLHAASNIKLFITATHVGSGQARVFSCEEITAEVLLASTCIPFLSQAIEIGGEYYWDGGYMGNPAIWPLIYKCKSEDVALVQINPIHREMLPKTADEIINRLNEITFNSSLIAEMRAIDFVSRLLKKKRLDKRHYKDMRMHLIYASDEMHNLNASSKMNTDWDFFLFLKDIGRKTAEDWLRAKWEKIGVASSVNIRDKFLSRGPAKKPLKKRANKNK